CKQCGQSAFLPESTSGARVACPYCNHPLGVTEVEPARETEIIAFLPVEDDEPPRVRRDDRLRFGRPTDGAGRETDAVGVQPVPGRAGAASGGSASGAGMGLGIGSTVVGLSQAAVCFLGPLVVVLSISVALVGFLLGGAGLVFGLARKKAGVGFPILGLVTNAL